MHFLGVFEHLYSTNFAEKPGVGTHYVVLACELTPGELPEKLPADQPGEYRWFDIDTPLSTEAVHAHTKRIFSEVLDALLVTEISITVKCQFPA